MVNSFKYSFKYSFLILLLILLSCKKEDILNNDECVLIIMDANNNLKQNAFGSINKMERGIAPGRNLYVYIKSESTYSYILRIKKDQQTNIINRDTILKINTLDLSKIEEFKLAINHVQQKNKIKGIVLWSHSTAWAPSNNAIKTRSFGDDNGVDVDIIRLAEIIPPVEFILFDSCSMASLEVLFEFKDKCHYIIASPTETIADSFPYDLMVNDLFGKEQNLIQACVKYFNYYNSFQDKRRAASISLILSEKLNNIASQLKAHKGNRMIFPYEYEKVQRLDYSFDFPIPLYDFGDFLFHNFDKLSMSYFEESLREAIIYKANTEYFIDLPINNFSGLSIWIPTSGDSFLKDYYRNLKFYKETQMF